MRKLWGKVRGKCRQLKYRLKHDFLVPENVVLVAAVVMCLVWTYQSIEAMNRNWALTERLNAESKELELKRVEAEAAELENEYLKTDEYQELSARKYANKQMPGEHMVYMPENSEAAKNKHTVQNEATDVSEAKESSNCEKWMMYLFP